jgi:hypothetical protein
VSCLEPSPRAKPGERFPLPRRRIDSTVGRAWRPSLGREPALNPDRGGRRKCHPEPPESRGWACGCEGRRTAKDPEVRAGGEPFAQNLGILRRATPALDDTWGRATPAAKETLCVYAAPTALRVPMLGRPHRPPHPPSAPSPPEKPGGEGVSIGKSWQERSPGNGEGLAIEYRCHLRCRVKPDPSPLRRGEKVPKADEGFPVGRTGSAFLSAILFLWPPYTTSMANSGGSTMCFLTAH